MESDPSKETGGSTPINAAGLDTETRTAPRSNTGSSKEAGQGSASSTPPVESGREAASSANVSSSPSSSRPAYSTSTSGVRNGVAVSTIDDALVGTLPKSGMSRFDEFRGLGGCKVDQDTLAAFLPTNDPEACLAAVQRDPNTFYRAFSMFWGEGDAKLKEYGVDCEALSEAFKYQ